MIENLCGGSEFFLGLRVNEWVILGLKARQTGGLRRTFALRLGSEFAMNIGWHEH
jgi:hypothetical protein